MEEGYSGRCLSRVGVATATVHVRHVPGREFHDAAKAAAGDCSRTPGRAAKREWRIRRAAFDQTDGEGRAAVVQDRGGDRPTHFHLLLGQEGKEGQTARRRHSGHP